MTRQCVAPRIPISDPRLWVACPVHPVRQFGGYSSGILRNWSYWSHWRCPRAVGHSGQIKDHVVETWQGGVWALLPHPLHAKLL